MLLFGFYNEDSDLKILISKLLLILNGISDVTSRTEFEEMKQNLKKQELKDKSKDEKKLHQVERYKFKNN
jgi:hypothetical protein